MHQRSSDLLTWQEVVEDTKYADYYARPGMPTVAKLPNDEYIYVYEYGGAPTTGSYWFPVYYRLSEDPLAFLEAPDQQLISDDGTTPAGSPYVVWSSYGGENGTIVVSCGTLPQIFTNQALGHPDAWKKWEVPQPAAYTRALLVFEEDPDLLMIMGAGDLPPGKTNEVSASVVRLSEIIKA